MLWLKRKEGQAFHIDGERLLIVERRRQDVRICFCGKGYVVPFGTSLQFPKFTLHVALLRKGLRFGFECDRAIAVVREELV